MFVATPRHIVLTQAHRKMTEALASLDEYGVHSVGVHLSFAIELLGMQIASVPEDLAA